MKNNLFCIKVTEFESSPPVYICRHSVHQALNWTIASHYVGLKDGENKNKK